MPTPMPTPNGAHRARRSLRRTGALLAVLTVVTFGTGACVSQRDPTGYGASVRSNFVTGCLAGYAPQKGKDPEAATHRTLCGCIYDEMANDDTGIAFDEFKSAQAAIRKDPTNPANTMDKLIPEFTKIRRTCEGKVTTGPAARTD